MKRTNFENLPETTIGDRLAKLRIKKGKSQEEISEVIDVSPKAYGKYEQGANCISVDNVKKLSNYYNTSLDYIILGRKKSSMDIVADALAKYPEDQQKIILNSMIKMIEEIFPIMQSQEYDL